MFYSFNIGNKSSRPCWLHLRRGQEFTREWMDSNCKVIYESELAAGTSVGDIARFSSRFTSGADSKTHPAQYRKHFCVLSKVSNSKDFTD